jgi:hypothetical protein
MLSAPADDNHNSLQPRVRKHATDQTLVWGLEPAWSPDGEEDARGATGVHGMVG